MTEKDSGGTTIEQATYTYDALDRRIGIDDNSTQAWITYDGSQAYADFNGSGSLTNRYLNAQAVDQLLARTSSGGTTAWYLNDHLGSVRDVVTFSQMGVTILDHIAYDPYGNIIQETSSSNGDRMKYGQLQWDAVAQVYLAINRPFDAISGRWISPDPLGFKAGDANLYRYVGNDSVASIDPSGLYYIGRIRREKLFFYKSWMTVVEEWDIVEPDLGQAEPGILLGMMPLWPGLALSEGAIAAEAEGIYQFTGKTGKPYVGQSGNIPQRIQQHLGTTKLPPGSPVQFTEVLGGRLAREIAEQELIDSLGGIDNLENLKNPIGPLRQHLKSPRP